MFFNLDKEFFYDVYLFVNDIEIFCSKSAQIFNLLVKSSGCSLFFFYNLFFSKKFLNSEWYRLKLKAKSLQRKSSTIQFKDRNSPENTREHYPSSYDKRLK